MSQWHGLVVMGIVLLGLPALVQAASIQTVAGLSNGRVLVTYQSGQESIERIFSAKTAEPTLVVKLSKQKFVAVQANGRKLAWVNTQKPNDLEIDRLNLVDDVSYTQAWLAVPDFDEDRLPLVVAKRGDTTDVMFIDRFDGDLEKVTELRFDNTNIVPSKTKISEGNLLIRLRNQAGSTLDRITVVTGDNLQLVRQRDPVTCDNQWYETHAHMEEVDALDEYVNRLEDHGIGCSLLFVGMEWDNLAETYTEVKAIVENNPGRFIPFYNGDPNTLAEISVENLQSILDKDTKHLFRGIGEFAFYQDPLLNTALTDDPWPDIFQWAADQNMIVMVHLNATQGAELDTMLDTYPNTTVLLHGRELAQSGDLATLLAEHSNLYFTLDTANMINVDGPLMFPVQGGDDDDVSDKTRANDFVEDYDANVTTMLSDSHTLFDELFTVAPNQVLWGTDTAFTWHTRPAVYRRLIEFTQAFDEGAEYVTTNAQTLLGDGVTMD